jgi:chromosome segregation ATPase
MSERLGIIDKLVEETNQSQMNIQKKMIEIENHQLKYNDRIRVLEKDMKVTKNTEKALDDKIKMVNKDIKALDASFQNQLHKKCKPIEDKVMIILGTVDDVENQIEEIRECVNNLDFSKAQFNEDGEAVNNPKFRKLSKKIVSPEQKQSRVTAMSQVMDSQIESLKNEYK